MTAGGGSTLPLPHFTFTPPTTSCALLPLEVRVVYFCSARCFGTREINFFPKLDAETGRCSEDRSLPNTQAPPGRVGLTYE